MSKQKVFINDDSDFYSESVSLENRTKTSLRERSMNSDNDYPGVE